METRLNVWMEIYNEELWVALSVTVEMFSLIISGWHFHCVIVSVNSTLKLDSVLKLIFYSHILFHFDEIHYFEYAVYNILSWFYLRGEVKRSYYFNFIINSNWLSFLTLSKPPQRRQGPDLRPLWLLVGTPSAIRHELASRRVEHSLSYSDVTIYIFAIKYLSPMLYVYRFLWPLRLGGCWFVVYIRRCIYKFLAHLSRRLEWAIVIAHRPSSVRPSVRLA